MLRTQVGRLGLLAVTMTAVLACTTATATPSPQEAISPPATESGTQAPQTEAPSTPNEVTQPPQSSAPESGVPQTGAPQSVAPATTPPTEPTGSPSEAPESSGPSSAPTFGPPSPSPTPAPLIINWNPVSNPGLDGASDINASAASGNRFVALGGDENGNQMIWSSGDGRTWSKSDFPNPSNELTLNDVAALGSGFIAVGEYYLNGGPKGTVLTSTDGRSWQLLSSASLDGDFFQSVAVMGQTVVIDADGTFQVSTDGGGTWTQPAYPSGMASQGLLALTTNGTDFWAYNYPSVGGRLSPIGIWNSSDGKTWTPVGALSGSQNLDTLIVANGSLGWVAIASGTRRGGSKDVDDAWSSADGITWQAATPAPFGITDIFADDSGFIAVGNWYPNGSGCVLDPAEAQGVTFTSTDGALWTRMPTDGWDSKYVEQLRRDGRTLIGIGVDYSKNEYGTGAAWTAKLPPLATNQGPVPTTPPMPPNGC